MGGPSRGSSRFLESARVVGVEQINIQERFTQVKGHQCTIA